MRLVLAAPVGAASSSTDVSIDEMAARNLLLEQRLQVNFLGMKMKPGDEVARLPGTCRRRKFATTKRR